MGIHRLPVNTPHRGQWCRALMISLICAWINGWANGWGWWFETPSAHYDVTVMDMNMSLVFKDLRNGLSPTLQQSHLFDPSCTIPINVYELKLIITTCAIIQYLAVQGHQQAQWWLSYVTFFFLDSTGIHRMFLPDFSHDDIIKWRHFPRYLSFVRGIPLTKARDAELWCILWSAPKQTAE